MARLSWQIEIRHDGLNAYRVVRGRDAAEVQLKAALQQRAWDAHWTEVQERVKKREQQQLYFDRRRRNPQIAAERSTEAADAIAALRRILRDGLARDPRVDWTALECHERFSIEPPPRPKLHSVAAKPVPERYVPRLTWLDHLLPSRRARKESEATRALKDAERQWDAHRQSVERINAEVEKQYADAVTRWTAQKDSHEKRAADHNKVVAELRAAYDTVDATAVADYCDLVLAASPYPDYFPRSAEIAYVPETGRLVLDYDLPGPEQLPRMKDVRYVASRDVFTESVHTDSYLHRLYDDVLYQVTLRVVHELFAADGVLALESIAFNGWVHATDRATGSATYSPILSLYVTRDEFAKLDLAQVDPKSCFKKLKGVSGSRLHDLAAVRPLIEIERNDARFVPSGNISVPAATNLAAMDWEDFEHLIRELFEREFSANGGEVHITRASRDAGVDAVAFDPDPIRGGKIVIQAKRYTNTVDVSAVRDLYGTVHNEGANKGILVTTSDYGADAYEFVKGKPLTLLNGAHLLYLLQKHGYHARIDIAEARQVLQGHSRRGGSS